MKYKVTFTVSDRECEKSLLLVSHELGSTPIYANGFKYWKYKYSVVLNTGSKIKT